MIILKAKMLMKKSFQILGLLLLSTLILGSCKSKTKTSIKISDAYLVKDFEQDKDYPAGIIELQIPIPETDIKIYGFEYTANGRGPHPTLVFLHGNPGNERNLDIAQNLRKVGYNIIYFDFRGSWGSKGEFTFENNIADTKAVINYLTDPENVRELRIDTNKIALFGHNTGAAVALMAGLDDPRIKGIASLSLFNPYRVIKSPTGAINLSNMKEYLATLGMLNINADQFLKEMVANVNRYNLEKYLSLTNKYILVIDEYEANDYLKKLKGKPNVNYEIWDTDIAFSNKRTALVRRLKDWLDLNINPVAPIKPEYRK
ncbi:MAG: alpha/beta hydrolase [Sphingobacteriaceae bacterium]